MVQKLIPAPNDIDSPTIPTQIEWAGRATVVCGRLTHQQVLSNVVVDIRQQHRIAKVRNLCFKALVEVSIVG
jgi:hypothetical protein